MVTIMRKRKKSNNDGEREGVSSSVRGKLKPSGGAVNQKDQVRNPHGLFPASNVVLQPTFSALCIAGNSIKQKHSKAQFLSLRWST